MPPGVLSSGSTLMPPVQRIMSRRFPGLGHGIGHVLYPVPGVGDGNGLNAVGGQLILDHRRKGILNEALFHLAAGGHNGGGAPDPGLELQQRSISSGSLRRLELLLRDDEGDHPHACQLVPLRTQCRPSG